MTNFTQRLLLFVIGLPLLLFLIVYFADYSHIGWIVLVAGVTFMATYESLDLFAPGFRAARRHLVPIAAALLPLSALVHLELYGGHETVLIALAGSLLLLLTIELAVWNPESPESYLMHSLGITASLLYPGLLMIYPIRFIEFEYAVPAILLFLLLNFANDTFAYLFGLAFGRYSVRIVPVSPKKTLIGYIGGIIGSLLGGVGFYLLYPALFAFDLYFQLPFFLLIALLADIGDLVESAFKRGMAMKDSGRLMPGRGGLLDSTDSLLFSAPFFYYIGIILLN
jgi:phosphatidate cytidylyltransferase